jgi:hypothetical protein
MTHMRWKCEQHLNDANPLVAATWSKPLNNFNHVRNLPASNNLITVTVEHEVKSAPYFFWNLVFFYIFIELF